MPGRYHGALVLSEFAGAAQELRDAILVNPYDLDDLKQAIRHAVDLDPNEGTGTQRRMRRVVRRHDVHAWARGVSGRPTRRKRSLLAPARPAVEALGPSRPRGARHFPARR